MRILPSHLHKLILSYALVLFSSLSLAQEAEILDYGESLEGEEAFVISFPELALTNSELNLKFEVADHSRFDLDPSEEPTIDSTNPVFTMQEHKFPCARTGKVSFAIFAEYGDGGFSLPKSSVRDSLEELFQEPIAGVVLGFRFGQRNKAHGHYKREAEYGFCSFAVMRENRID